MFSVLHSRRTSTNRGNHFVTPAMQFGNCSRHARERAARTRWAARAGTGLSLFAGIWPRVGTASGSCRHRQSGGVLAAFRAGEQAKTASANADLLLPGNTEAINVASIYARANGYVRERMVDIGSVVKAGQTLAVIESPEVDQELAQARAALEQTRAALEQANANLEQAQGRSEPGACERSAGQSQRGDRRDHRPALDPAGGTRRASEAVGRRAPQRVSGAAGGIGSGARGTAHRRSQRRLREPRISAPRGRISRRRPPMCAAWSSVQGFERVLAPFDGVVTERKVERGDLVTAGSGGDRNLFTVAQAKNASHPGERPAIVRGRSDAGPDAPRSWCSERPGRTFTGTVARTAQALDSTSRTLLTEVQVDNSSGELLPGMYAQVKFSIPRSAPVVVIPADALIANAQGTRVAVVDSASRVHFRNVQVGRDIGTASGSPVRPRPADESVDRNAPDTSGGRRRGGGATRRVERKQ